MAFLVNAQNKNITLRETFESYYLGYALNYMLFGIAGDVIKTIYLVQNKENKIGISLSVVIDRAIGLLSMLMILIIFLPKIFINSNIFDINSIFHNVNHYYSFISIFFIVFLLFIRKCLNSRRINKIIILYLYKYKNKIVKFIAKTLKNIFYL